MDDETRQRGGGVKEDEARERLRQMCLHPFCHLVAWLYCGRGGVTTGAGENTFPLRRTNSTNTNTICYNKSVEQAINPGARQQPDALSSLGRQLYPRGRPP